MSSRRFKLRPDPGFRQDMQSLFDAAMVNPGAARPGCTT
ncbi:hypothetical protein AHiyo8_01840 [Arthrobacter sp. Hiyo8]|nr:hypothetical protein AHiyo8_01840 [Arthrobacter sp. Hiyo8]